MSLASLRRTLLINGWSLTVIAIVLTVLSLAPTWETLFAAVTALILNRVGGPEWRVDMGLTKRLSLKEGLFVLAIAVALFFFTKLVLQPLCDQLTHSVRNLHSFDRIRGRPEAAILLILKTMLLAGVGEEIIFRGTVLQRLRLMIGGGPVRTAVAVLIATFVFASFHWYQGPSGLLLVFILALLDSALFIAFGNRLAISIILHLVYDTLALAAIASNQDLVLSRWGASLMSLLGM